MPVEETITVKQDTTSVINNAEPKIENLTSGNIIEKPISQNQIEYNKSLDALENISKTKLFFRRILSSKLCKS